MVRHMTNLYKCKKTNTFITEPCQENACEWWLRNETLCNCTWVACNYGPFTLEEVGEMMGVTRERIRQIEAKALRKLQHKKRRDQLKDFSTSNYENDIY
jgi:hypothetical protein